jgi:hypothetical protein
MSVDPVVWTVTTVRRLHCLKGVVSPEETNAGNAIGTQEKNLKNRILV